MQMNQMNDYENDENILEKFGRNINEQVKNNKVDPVIGRDEEIRKIITVLARKTKNNVILLGEPGVGKTAIIEGLAQRIVKNDVPATLKDKEIFELDIFIIFVVVHLIHLHIYHSSFTTYIIVLF